jgi:hypothetical protein
LEHAAASRARARVELAGEDTRRRLGNSAQMLCPGQRVPPTQPGRRARGLALQVTAGQRDLVVQVYDAAGAWFGRSERAEELAYLGKTRTFVLVVDPLAMPSVWGALDAAEQLRLAGERSLTPDPEQVYMRVRDEVARQYSTLNADLRRTRLAVVVTRGDLLADTSVSPVGVAPERWVRESLGIRNVLRAARSDFGSARVFVTGAVAGPEGRPDPSLTTLSRWLLAPEGGVVTALLAPESAPVPEPPGDPGPPQTAPLSPAALLASAQEGR